MTVLLVVLATSQRTPGYAGAQMSNAGAAAGDCSTPSRATLLKVPELKHLLSPFAPSAELHKLLVSAIYKLSFSSAAIGVPVFVKDP